MKKDIFEASTLDADEALLVYNYASITERRVRALEKYGFKFISGNNPKLGLTKKWSDHYPIRVAQTNSTKHGYSTQTLWAVRENGDFDLPGGFIDLYNQEVTK